MRSLFATLVICLVVTAARAQTATSAAPSASTTANQNTRPLLLPPPNPSLLYLRPEKPNAIRLNHVIYDGILVHLGKRENPLQLINPVAQPPYSSMDNVVLDPITQNVTGWKLFSISF